MSTTPASPEATLLHPTPGVADGSIFAAAASAPAQESGDGWVDYSPAFTAARRQSLAAIWALHEELEEAKRRLHNPRHRPGLARRAAGGAR